MLRVEITFRTDDSESARLAAEILMTEALACDAIKVHDEPPFCLVVTFMESTECTARFIKSAHRNASVERLRTYTI